jgi:hypothetical protein
MPFALDVPKTARQLVADTVNARPKDVSEEQQLRQLETYLRTARDAGPSIAEAVRLLNVDNPDSRGYSTLEIAQAMLGEIGEQLRKFAPPPPAHE